MAAVASKVAFAAVFLALTVSAQAASRSDTGRRGISGAVEVSPVDRLGPTLPPDNLLTPDSGWNGNDTAGVLGPYYTTAPALFAPPPPPPKHHHYIILNNGK